MRTSPQLPSELEREAMHYHRKSNIQPETRREAEKLERQEEILRLFAQEAQLDLERLVNGMDIDYNLPFERAEAKFETSYLISHLKLARGVKEQAAKNADMPYSTFRRRLDELKIDSSPYDIRKNGRKVEKKETLLHNYTCNALMHTQLEYAKRLPVAESAALQDMLATNKLSLEPKLIGYKEAMDYFNFHYLNSKLQRQPKDRYGKAKIESAAKEMDLPRSTLYNKLYKYGYVQK